MAPNRIAVTNAFMQVILWYFQVLKDKMNW
jgi:hypothetical protein